MVDAERDTESVLVASEPLNEDDGWQRVPPNHMVVVQDRIHLDIQPCS